MHPHNIFGEALLLFIIGVLLLIRERGSAASSTAYDVMLGCLMILFSLVRFVEFLGGVRDGHVMARSIVWLMWALPVAILSCLLYYHMRIDIGVILTIAIGCLIAVTIYLMSGGGGYDIISPDTVVGSTNGIYSWIRTDGTPHFLPFGYYMLLTVTLIYLTALSMKDRIYWLLTAATIFGFVTASLFIPQIAQNPLATLGSLSTLVMLGLGTFAILLVPG